MKLLVANAQDARASRGLFVITASTVAVDHPPMLFIKSVVGRELFINDRAALEPVEIPPEVQANVRRLLKKVDQIETYNPLDFHLNIEREVVASLARLDRKEQAQRKAAALKRNQAARGTTKAKRSKIAPLKTNA
eukprot:m.297933 g.297933  ORF g.297933 m.297933 type:complete len:135 (+) comp86169_c0_seq1:98-502(+)